MPLAKYGLGWARHYIDDTLAKLGIETSHDKMNISRVDYAVDILAPEFLLDANCFVTHAPTKQKTHDEIDHMTTVGHSGRTTSVTVGSNPGRQVIIYDKREEVFNKSDKVVWWDIWDANLAKMGKPPLDRADPSKSRGWRIELRAYKRHLKDDWNLRTWADLDAMLHAVMTLMASEIRYAQPCEDSNRSRWPDHAIWSLVLSEIEQDLPEMTPDVPAASLSATIAMQKRNELLRLFLGIGTSLAGLKRILPHNFSGFMDKIKAGAKSLSKQNKIPLKTRLEKAAGRYMFIGQMKWMLNRLRPDTLASQNAVRQRSRKYCFPVLTSHIDSRELTYLRHLPAEKIDEQVEAFETIVTARHPETGEISAIRHFLDTLKDRIHAESLNDFFDLALSDYLSKPAGRQREGRKYRANDGPPPALKRCLSIVANCSSKSNRPIDTAAYAA